MKDTGIAVKIECTTKEIDLEANECQYEKHVREYFGLPESVNENTDIKTDFGQLVNMVSMFRLKDIGCKCEDSIGWSEIKCCNICGLPTEEFWTKNTES